MDRNLVYFVADVHLGLAVADPREREDRFVAWLKSLSRTRTRALYLLGDIWDFWYEYHDVIPKEGVRVVAQLIDLMDAGVEVAFVRGNHDIWTYHFFESLGIRMLDKVSVVEHSGVSFCLAHGDGLADASFSYRLMLGAFNSRFLQALFSLLHPTLAFRLAKRSSRNNRLTHKKYVWKGLGEAPVKFAEQRIAAGHRADHYIFGHYHLRAAETLSDGSDLHILDTWLSGGTPHLLFDGSTLIG